MQQFYANGLAMPILTDGTTPVTAYPPKHIRNKNVFLQNPIKKIATTQTGRITKPNENFKTSSDENSFRLPSVTVRRIVGNRSNLRPNLFDTCSGGVRELFECCSGGTRRTLEGHPKDYRTSPEPVPKRTRRASEGHPNSTRRNRWIFAGFLRKLKVETTRGLSDLITTQAQPKDDLRITQQRPKDDLRLTQQPPNLGTTYRQGSPKDGTTNTQETANNDTRNVRLVYRECTVSVRGVYRKGTREPLRRHWRATTDLLNACSSTVPKQYSNRQLAVASLTSKAIPWVAVWLCFMLFSVSDAWAQSGRTLSGVVRSAADGQPLQGVTISVEKGPERTVTDQEGRFSLYTDREKGTLSVSFIGFARRSVGFHQDSRSLQINLEPADQQIDEVEVMSTGYQRIPKERATGSFEFVDSALFNRKVSTDFVSRLEDVVPSISSEKGYPANRGKRININVRGVSTMQSERWPLVVIDGVPYPNNFDGLNGYFNNINPNDVENVTVLKDAAASSIWGAQSGNGVIVITTKRAKYNQPFQLSVNSNMTIGQKPDLYYYPQMSSSDYIDAEKKLFDGGYWNSRMYRYNVNLTPVIQLLKKHREGDITEQILNAELDKLRGVDMREDFLKYIYRPSSNQQYSVQLRGGSEKINSAFSVGYDNNRDNLVTSSYSRLTAKNNTQLRPIKNLTLDLGLTYTESKRKDAQTNMVGYNSMGRGWGNFPYMRLADDNGRALVVDAIARNPIFRDTVAGGRLLDAKYRPLDELYETHELVNIRETFVNTLASYNIFPWLKASLLYAFQYASQPSEDWRGLGSAHQRESINYFASWDSEKVTWNKPIGDYLYKLHRHNNTQQGRFHIDINRDFGAFHHLDAIIGSEIRQIGTEVSTTTFHGYDPETLSYQNVAYGKSFKVLNGIGGSSMIYDYAQTEKMVNRFTSYFVNAAYTYNNRYTLSGSARKDASNLFGIKTNDRGQPFWSIGASWVLSNERFVNNDWLSLLKLRTTYGYNGNVNNSTAAYPIIAIQNTVDYITGQPYAIMRSPPNPSLRWERVGMLNFGLDFSLCGNRFSGSFEYYIKRPKDLIAQTQIDPTTGFSTLAINSADLDGRGLDINLNSNNVSGRNFRWMTNLVFAYNRTRVLHSYVSNNLARNYTSGPAGMIMTPFEGMDLYSQLAYPWAGLDPDDGSPLGYLDGEVSKDYGTLVNRTTVDQIDNHGSLRPLYFGSLRNTFSYKEFEFSFNVAFNLGHKFLKTSFNAQQFIDNGVGHSDYANRWQKPGDEERTDIPAFTYPNNLFASQLYYASSVLVQNASWIKLRDLQVSYNFSNRKSFPLKGARVYAYAQQIGMLWSANAYGLDPEFGGRTAPDPFALSFGFNFNL